MFYAAHKKPTIRLLLCALALLGTSLLNLQAQAQPSQKPLLASQSGAKPNLMITLDNSGSMAFSYHETYGVVADTNSEIELIKCPKDEWSVFTGNWVLGGFAGINNIHNVNSCINLTLGVYTNNATAYAKVTGSQSAQRSADVNPVYYNPRTTYHARVDASGNALKVSDGYEWVSNQSSTSVAYTVYKNNDDQIITQHSMFEGSVAPPPSGYDRVYGYTFPWRIPQHIAYAKPDGNTPGFTYSYCSNVTTWDGVQMGCAKDAWKDVTIKYGASDDVALPKGHHRTDCKRADTNTCSNVEETKNIMNWYRYYAFRAPAVATAIGQAVANKAFDSNLRIGYMSINRRNGLTVGATDQTPGVDTGNTAVLRGVRLHAPGSSDTQRFYTWLYDQDGTQNRNSNNGKDPSFNSTENRREAPYGGTPLHNAVARVADYFRAGKDAKENPWATNPAALGSGSNPEKGCRRSFNLLFSDGAWNAGTSTIPGLDYDDKDGPAFERTLANGSTESFTYLKNGPDSVAGRSAYTPFPSTGTGGLADLTAKYAWHTDFRSELANEGQTRAGQPAFWQNMATYTVGYLIRPTGEVPGAVAGLTFDQIRTYQAEYADGGYAKATKPAWANGDLNAATASDQDRINDFVQAGYTGGGKGFSARTADDVRSIFNTIISEILNSIGRDAGVAVGSGSDSTSVEGSLKYGVSYRTLDNSGDITAELLDANGNVRQTNWKAADRIGAHGDRKVFTMSGDTSATDFSGELIKLPADIQAALKPSSIPAASRIPDDKRFVDYLRGKDPVTDAQGALFRQRPSKMGAIVNAPPLYMGDSRDFAYDLGSTVSGKEAYEAYIKAKRALPASLFVATNAGVMHALDAKDGNELAAFLPRRSLRRMLNYANPDYTFEYTLDGPLSEHDIYDGTRWNHIAMGSGGRGEQLLYAVRSPLNQTSTPNRTPGQSDFLWESGPDRINDTGLTMGYITNPVRSGQTVNGEWIAVTSSGHLNGNTDGSKHGLVVLNAMTGAKIRAIPLPKAYSTGDSTKGRTNGLGGVTLVRDANKRIVAAYAGDANGNLWRFDLKGPPSTWAVSYNKPLFTAAHNRPIYGAPAWQLHPKGGAIVVAATGILLSDADMGNTDANEAIYGIWDPTPVGKDDVESFTPIAPEHLLQQTVLQGTENAVGSNTFYRASKNAIDWKVHRGWTMPLGSTHKGERSLDQIRNVGKTVLIATTVLTAPSTSGEETCAVAALPPNFLYALNALDGASTRFFVSKRDAKVDYASVVFVGEGGYARGMALATPSSTWTPSDREYRASDSGNGEGSATPLNCRPSVGVTQNTENNPIRFNAECTVPGWSRNQYQLSHPPSN